MLAPAVVCDPDWVMGGLAVVVVVVVVEVVVVVVGVVGLGVELLVLTTGALVPDWHENNQVIGNNSKLLHSTQQYKN